MREKVKGYHAIRQRTRASVAALPSGRLREGFVFGSRNPKYTTCISLSWRKANQSCDNSGAGPVKILKFLVFYSWQTLKLNFKALLLPPTHFWSRSRTINLICCLRLVKTVDRWIHLDLWILFTDSWRSEFKILAFRVLPLPQNEMHEFVQHSTASNCYSCPIWLW